MTPSGPEHWRIASGDGVPVSALFERADAADCRDLFVCAHGAGGHLDDASMRAASAEVLRHGAHVLRFNFPYREKGSKRPDPIPQLKASYAAVVAHAREAVSPARLIIGGRSMGGRVASLLAAEGFSCDAMLLLAYPLHPAGQPEKLRDQHLARIEVPVLCINGTRDALCRRDLMERTVTQLAPSWTMHWLDGADHSFHVLKSSGRTDREVISEVGAAFERWNAHMQRG